MNRNKIKNALRELWKIQGKFVMYPQYIVFDGDDAELENFQTCPYAANDDNTLVLNCAEDVDSTIGWLESELQ